MTVSKSLPKGSAGYGAKASVLAQQYESITFADVHRDTLHLFPATPSLIADIGAGSGRDAAALAALGHRVLAVEPTPELRAEGQRLHPDVAIEWIDDALPDLSTLRRRGEQVDMALLTAVWMHLDEEERRVALEALDGLLARSGMIVMSLRHGPVPEGRRMFDVSFAETAALAARYALKPVFRCEREDMLGRPDVRWTFLALSRS